MSSDEIIRLVAFVKRAKNRRKVLETLQQPMLPSELMLAVFGSASESYFSTISRALRELEEQKIVELINPKERTGRTYRLTRKGEEVISFIQRQRRKVEI
jgi:DNA-binding HxlR family transcriptional regulator